MSSSLDEVTELLQAWSGGDVAARDRLFHVAYGELRRVAGTFLRRERCGHILQPTALVHEAYIRLVDQKVAWQSRSHFFAVASQTMRRILVDRARARHMGKRSGEWSRVTLDDGAAMTVPADVDILDLDSALKELAALDARKSRIAELRLCAGLSLEEVGLLLRVSPRTVEREWQAARAWLSKVLSGTR